MQFEAENSEMWEKRRLVRIREEKYEIEAWERRTRFEKIDKIREEMRKTEEEKIESKKQEKIEEGLTKSKNWKTWRNISSPAQPCPDQNAQNTHEAGPQQTTTIKTTTTTTFKLKQPKLQLRNRVATNTILKKYNKSSSARRNNNPTTPDKIQQQITSKLQQQQQLKSEKQTPVHSYRE